MNITNITIKKKLKILLIIYNKEVRKTQKLEISFRDYGKFLIVTIILCNGSILP